MVPESRIVTQKACLTYECNKEPKDGMYYHTLILVDDHGEEYTFRSLYTFKHDESGKANFSLDNIRTANFDSRGVDWIETK
jgi:uncharacterized protein YrzB (UPF0473 family)